MSEKNNLRFVVLDRALMERLVDDLVATIEGWDYAEWQQQNFLVDLPRKFEFSFVLYQETSICGFCVASGKLPNIYYIHLIFIKKECRGFGYGKEMLDHARKVCIERNLSGIRLRCPESNKGAHKFYIDYGFKELNLLQDEVSGLEADYILEYVVC